MVGCWDVEGLSGPEASWTGDYIITERRMGHALPGDGVSKKYANMSVQKIARELVVALETCSPLRQLARLAEQQALPASATGLAPTESVAPTLAVERRGSTGRRRGVPPEVGEHMVETGEGGAPFPRPNRVALDRPHP